MKDWKLILGVVGGSLALLVGAVILFDNGGEGSSEVQGVENSKLLEGARWSMGEEEAKVIVVEFSDLQCPACRSAERFIKPVAEMEGVRFVYRHFPLVSIHGNALQAAVAAEAAGEQGKFWEYKELLFDRQDDWAEVREVEKKFLEYAGQLELDEEKFEADLGREELEKRVKEDLQLGTRAGVEVTPMVFVNGEKVAANQLQGVVREKLSE